MLRVLVYPAGNLVFDGQFYYQYDGLNRLARVWEAGQLAVGNFDAEGRLLTDPNPLTLLGDPLADYFYDGLGRLIAKQARVSPACVPGDPPPPNCVVYEDYFCDGL